MIKLFIKTIVFIIILFVVIEVLPYFFAICQYNQLIKNIPLTKDKVEKILLFTSHKEISINKSLWGKHTQLNDNEFCWQYMILWKEPIDIVYDKNNSVVHIFESYE